MHFTCVFAAATSFGTLFTSFLQCQNVFRELSTCFLRRGQVFVCFFTFFAASACSCGLYACIFAAATSFCGLYASFCTAGKVSAGFCKFVCSAGMFCELFARILQRACFFRVHAFCGGGQFLQAFCTLPRRRHVFAGFSHASLRRQHVFACFSHAFAAPACFCRLFPWVCNVFAAVTGFCRLFAAGTSFGGLFASFLHRRRVLAGFSQAFCSVGMFLRAFRILCFVAGTVFCGLSQRRRVFRNVFAWICKTLQLSQLLQHPPRVLQATIHYTSCN